MNKYQIAILGCFGLLLIFLTGLIVLADFLGPTARAALLPVTSNGFEVVLGAVIGALTTLMASSQFNDPR